MHCTNLTVPVELSARNGVFDVKAPQNDIEVTDFILNNSQQGSNYTAKVLKEYKTVSGHYELAVDAPRAERIAAAFTELAYAI